MVTGLFQSGFVIALALLVGVGASSQDASRGEREVTKRGWPTQPIPLKPAAAAPYGATGAAQFESDGRTGLASRLVLTARGLSAGRYRVEVVPAPGSSPQLLGQISLTDPTAAPDPSANENTQQRNNSHQASGLDVQTQISLPSGFQVTRLTRILVTDGSGATVLSGEAGH